VRLFRIKLVKELFHFLVELGLQCKRCVDQPPQWLSRGFAFSILGGLAHVIRREPQPFSDPADRRWMAQKCRGKRRECKNFGVTPGVTLRVLRPTLNQHSLTPKFIGRRRGPFAGEIDNAPALADENVSKWGSCSRNSSGIERLHPPRTPAFFRSGRSAVDGRKMQRNAK
jgi:hypothetical protein